MMTCPHCQRANPADARFCTGCGQSLALSCAACQTANPADSRFCKACGAPLAASVSPQHDRRFMPPRSYTPKHLADKILTSRSALLGERKPVTVLFADVAGFSTLADRLDPETVHTLMDGCFAILTEQVHAYEGTINQFTGDGIMALFGAPIAHEDHAVRALHAALGIQAALRDYREVVQRQCGVPFHMRLGLNTGTVVVGRIGDDLRMDYTAQGDTTNLAARMQQMAPGGPSGWPRRRIARRGQPLSGRRWLLWR